MAEGQRFRKPKGGGVRADKEGSEGACVAHLGEKGSKGGKCQEGGEDGKQAARKNGVGWYRERDRHGREETEGANKKGSIGEVPQRSEAAAGGSRSLSGKGEYRGGRKSPIRERLWGRAFNDAGLRKLAAAERPARCRKETKGGLEKDCILQKTPSGRNEDNRKKKKRRIIDVSSKIRSLI